MTDPNAGRTSPLDPARLVDADGLAERWQCSRAFIYKMIPQGLPTLKLGRARRFRVADADAWLAARQGRS